MFLFLILGYTKLLIGLGLFDSGNTSTVEIIDLETSSSTCSDLPDFPFFGRDSIFGLNFQDNPMMCGSNDPVNNTDCFYFDNGLWNPSQPLTENRFSSGFSASPYPKVKSKIFVTGGGHNGTLSPISSAELLTDKGWESVASPLPTPLQYHCMVLLNSTTVMAIGGRDNITTANTYLLNTEINEWIEGPPLSQNRYQHSCGRIRKSKESSKFEIIVVGGFNGSDLSSVEIFDAETSAWRAGASLPIPITDAVLVEDPTGGVILVGGRSKISELDPAPLDTLFRLAHAEADHWQEMPQKLKSGRRYHSAFLIPNENVDCSFH